MKEKSSPCTGASWSGTARLYAVYAHSKEAELRGVAAIHDAQANENMQLTTFADEMLQERKISVVVELNSEASPCTGAV